ncbi:hypothetical protein ACM614_24425 [Streptomyces sp. 12297]
MNASSNSPIEAAPAGAANSAFSYVLGLLTLAISLIAMVMTLADDLGAGATAALIAADLVLVAAMGAVFATLRPQVVDGGERRTRDEEVLDALEPLGPAHGAGTDGR